MLAGIFLLLRRRKKVVLRIIIDHRFGEDLILAETTGLVQVFVHKRGYLIHIEIDIRDIRRIDQVNFINRVQQIEQEFLAVVLIAGGIIRIV